MQGAESRTFLPTRRDLDAQYRNAGAPRPAKIRAEFCIPGAGSGNTCGLGYGVRQDYRTGGGGVTPLPGNRDESRCRQEMGTGVGIGLIEWV